MSRTIRIALLLCDTPISAVQKEHGTYLDVFRTHLLASLPASQKAKQGEDVQLVLDGFDATTGQLPNFSDFTEGKDGAYQGLMITGSGLSVCLIVFAWKNGKG